MTILLICLIHAKEPARNVQRCVIAIIITIMVLDLKVPHGVGLAALKPLLPVFLSYVLSFIYVGIYWNNHHHLFYTAQQVSGVSCGQIYACFSGCRSFSRNFSSQRSKRIGSRLFL
jgi:Endosomal/lysosomal potassium channel TMEM175